MEYYPHGCLWIVPLPQQVPRAAATVPSPTRISGIAQDGFPVVTLERHGTQTIALREIRNSSRSRPSDAARLPPPSHGRSGRRGTLATGA